jgi:hypothetical protein
MILVSNPSFYDGGATITQESRLKPLGQDLIGGSLAIV